MANYRNSTTYRHKLRKDVKQDGAIDDDDDDNHNNNWAQ
jgi:hypothetical protein